MEHLAGRPRRLATKAEPATAVTLAARHNLSQFLLSLYASLRESGTPEMQAGMLPGVTAALKTLD